MALVAGALAAAGCGAEEPAAKGGPLAWVEAPGIVEAPSADGSRILQGEVRNTSQRDLRVGSADVRLRDAEGTAVSGNAIFLTGYVRPGEPQNRGGEPFADSEAERIGRLIRLAPGDTAPLVVSWRTRDGAPSEIAYPGGSLPVPGAR